MNKKKIVLMILMVVLVVYFGVNIFTSSQEGDMENIAEEDYQEPEVQEAAKAEKEYKHFYSNPAFLWPKITIGGTITAVITFVSIIMGIASYFIGYNAGGKLSKRTIFASIGTALAVGILGRSLTILIKVKIFELLCYIFPGDKLILGTIAEVIIYVLWITFIAGIAVYIYETFTVTAEEAHPTN